VRRRRVVRDGALEGRERFRQPAGEEVDVAQVVAGHGDVELLSALGGPRR
jgi:hypothetical protein